MFRVEHYTDRWRPIYDNEKYTYSKYEDALHSMRVFINQYVLIKPTCRIVDLETGAFIMDDMLREPEIGDIR